MNPDANLCQCFDSCPNIHSIASKAVELGDNEDVSFFESIKELRKGWTCGRLGRAADALRDDSLGVNVESCRFDFLNLIVGGLIVSGDAAVGEETGHGQPPVCTKRMSVLLMCPKIVSSYVSDMPGRGVRKGSVLDCWAKELQRQDRSKAAHRIDEYSQPLVAEREKAVVGF